MSFWGRGRRTRVQFMTFWYNTLNWRIVYLSCLQIVSPDKYFYKLVRIEVCQITLISHIRNANNVLNCAVE